MAARHKALGGTQISSIFQQTPDRRASDKNFARENLRGLKQLHQQIQEHKALAAVPVEPFKMARFKTVESQVFKHTAQAQLLDADKKPFLRRKSGQAVPSLATAVKEDGIGAVHQRRARETLKPSIPKPTQNGVISHHPPRNFIAANTREAVKMRPTQKSNSSASARHEDFGKLPSYLVERKLEWAEQEAKRREEQKQSDVPPGMIKIEEEERLRTLELLQAEAAKIESQIQRLPLVIETESRRRHKAELEQRFDELEAAIQQFSKTVVYIACS